MARALWNSDTPAAAVGVNLYGSHPVLYGIVPGSGGTAWGVFLANSNAMEFAAGSNDVTFRCRAGLRYLLGYLRACVGLHAVPDKSLAFCRRCRRRYCRCYCLPQADRR